MRTPSSLGHTYLHEPCKDAGKQDLGGCKATPTLDLKQPVHSEVLQRRGSEPQRGKLPGQTAEKPSLHSFFNALFFKTTYVGIQNACLLE